MNVKRIVAWVEFDDPVSQDEAVQTLGEAVLDESAHFEFHPADRAGDGLPWDAPGFTPPDAPWTKHV